MSEMPFIDLHSHILPAIDDGAIDDAEALAMARMAVADGIGTIVATPHQREQYIANLGPDIRERAAAFGRLLERENIPLRILPGGETRIEPSLVESEIIAKVQSGEVLTLGNQGRYFLIDLLPDVYVPLDRLVADLAALGLTAILAHPERNLVIRRNPEVLTTLEKAGCLFQVTAGSVLGEFGPPTQEFSERLVGQGLIHLIATDAHHVAFRKPLLAEAVARLEQWVGAAAAQAIAHTNPAAILSGQPTLSVPPLTVPA